MGSCPHAAAALVQPTRERQPLRSARGPGNCPRAPVDVTDVGEVVQMSCVPEPGGHLGVMGQHQLRVPEEVEIERLCGLAVLPATRQLDPGAAEAGGR